MAHLDEREKQALIEQIAARVLTAMDAAPAAESPDTLVLVSAPLALPDTIIAEVREEYGPDTAFMVCGEHMSYPKLAPAHLGPETEQAAVEQAAGISTLLLLAPGLSTLADVAAGQDEDLAARLCQRCLLWGKDVQVWLDFVPMRYKRNTFYEKVLGAIEALTDMGATVRAFDWLGGRAALPTLVTEQEVAACAAAGGGDLLCAAGAIVTPSARDRAAQCDIRIVPQG